MGYKPALPGDLDAQEEAQSIEQVKELLTNYGDVDIFWWDGNILMTEEEVHAFQPNTFVARGNIATPEGLKQGASYNVKLTNEAGWWWEMCAKTELEHTPYWHYNEIFETEHWSTNRLLTELIRCRSLGGNLLANITPRPNGEMMDWYYKLCAEMKESVSLLRTGQPLEYKYQNGVFTLDLPTHLSTSLPDLVKIVFK